MVPGDFSFREIQNVPAFSTDQINQMNQTPAMRREMVLGIVFFLVTNSMKVALGAS
jgi:hypothetical protein